MTKPQSLSKIGFKVSTLLKCPRCSTRFDAESALPTASGHVVCPNCSAKLRFRARPVVAAPVEPGVSVDAAQGISLPGLTDLPSSGTDGSVSVVESSGPGEIAIPGWGDGSSASAAAPAAAVNRVREQDVTLEPGTRLGGFEVRRVLGRGGMATVYKATQLSLNRPVAVKVLAKRFARNQLFVDRFDREAGALAGLNHPNIVNIIDKGVIEDNYFFVMEIVEGITLDQLLHSVELTEQHYLHIIGEISKALSYVHSKGIIHRDIKPSNILVNRQGVVKVGDFGIAHMTDAEAPAERTGRKATVGTAHYMSPEQATDPASVDQRADIYSLAVTFYKMFTRQLPPAGATSVTPPSEINLALPRTVDGIIARAMDPDPARRYSEVSEFCDALIAAFTSRTGNDLVGAATSSTGSLTESGTFLFNTNLFTASPSSSSTTGSGFGLSAVSVPSADLPSSITTPPPPTGTSLFAAPIGMPGMDSTSDTTSSGLAASPISTFGSPLSLDGGPTFNRPEPVQAADEEPEPGRKRLYIILTIVALLLLMLVGGGLFLYVRMTAY